MNFCLYPSTSSALGAARDIAERHVLEDLGFIPSLSDWLKEMPAAPWMAGAAAVELDIVD